MNVQQAKKETNITTTTTKKNPKKKPNPKFLIYYKEGQKENRAFQSNR